MGNDTEMSELRMTVAERREYFTTLVDSGFTEDQALQLLAAVLAGPKE